MADMAAVKVVTAITGLICLIVLDEMASILSVVGDDCRYRPGTCYSQK
jgi:hypothetical protein